MPAARPRTALVVAALVAVTSGCAASSSGATAASPTTDGTAATHAAAQALLAAWTAAHPVAAEPAFVPTGELLTQRGDWTDGPDAGGHKLAFVEGSFDLSAASAVPVAAAATVAWDDGVEVAADVLTPSDALAQAVTRPPAQPPEAPPLAVTVVTASTVAITTSRGPATAPAWDLTLADTPVHVVVVAARVASVPTGPPVSTPGRELPAVQGVTVGVDGGVTVGPDGRTLTATFVGAPDTGDVFCGEDYTAEAIGDAAAVVLTVFRHPFTGPAPTASGGVTVVCDLVGATRQANVTLAEPWAGRTVLDVVTGLPVTVG